MHRVLFLFFLACSASPAVKAHLALTRVDEEAPGANCEGGGVAVRAGTDSDDNGTLDETEVTSTQYVCNGFDGNDGAMGSTGSLEQAKVVSRATAEPAGVHCQYGGSKLELGLDDNENQQLDDAEVDATAYACGEDPFAHVYVGTLELHSAGDIAAAQHLTTVFGDVLIALDAPGTVALPNLAMIQGRLRDCGAQPNQATSIAFDALAAAAGGVELRCSPALVSLALPALAFTTSVLLDSAPLTSADFTALASVPGDVTITSTALGNLPMPALTHVGGLLTVSNNANLDDCALIGAVHARRAAGGTIRLVPSNQLCTNSVSACPQVTIGADPSGHRFCYYLSTWTASEARCETIGLGWRLAYLQSDAELAALSTTPLLAAPNLRFWIGYTDLAVANTFTWAVGPSGSTGAQAWINGPQAYAPQSGAPFWHSGEPNNYNGYESCTHLRSEGSAMTANDSNCDATDSYALCRYMAP